MARLQDTIGKDFLRQENTNILRYLPDFLSDYSNTFKQSGDAQSYEHDQLKSYILDIFNQMFISTATWGLTLWENDLFLKVDPEDSYETRRQRIWNKLQFKKTSTLEYLTELLNNYNTDKDGTITELYSDYALEYHIRDGSITNWTELLEVINQWKPAHLAFHFVTHTEISDVVYFGAVVSDSEEIYISCKDKDYTIETGASHTPNTESDYIPLLLNHSRGSN